MLFIASVVLFEVGSVLCGAAPNMNALIVGRVLAGLGGSGVYIGYDTISCKGKLPLIRSQVSSITSLSVPQTKNVVGMCRASVLSGVLAPFWALWLEAPFPTARLPGVGRFTSICRFFGPSL